MDQQNVGDLPLIEQIVDQTLKRLAENSAFDAETLTRLRELAKSSGLVKYNQVVSALGTDLED
jgi:hypothetical protein